jgi:hypothetical protein
MGEFYGNLKNEIPNGDGMMIFFNSDKHKFVGQWKSGVPSKGVMEYENGDLYDGEFNPKGSPDGEGIMIYSSENGAEKKFVGQWNDGLPLKGVMEYKNGDHYDGEFVQQGFFEGYPDGEGIMIYSSENGARKKFVGQWNEGLPLKGVMEYKNGDHYDGEFDQEGYPDGEGIMIYYSSESAYKKFVGQWKDGNPYKGVMEYKNGNINDDFVNTPRTNYANQFKQKDIYLANKNFRSDKPNRLLFQISFHDDVNQFKKYTNLSARPSIDCVYQSLFALGLRELNQAKQDASKVNKFGKTGVFLNDLQKFIETTFDLPRFTLKMPMIISDSTGRLTVEEQIGWFLDDLLNVNYATMIYLHFKDHGGIVRYAHCIIAYRTPDAIYYFDPQGKGIKEEDEVISTNLLHLVPESLSIDKAYFLMMNNLDLPKKATHVECPIEFSG